jgi:hypothetical protein
VLARNNKAPVALVALSLLATTPAWAQEDAPAAPPARKAADASSDEGVADHAIKLPNFYGLSGMREMIDARTPDGLTIRGGVRLQQQKESTAGHLIEFDRERLDLQAYAGVALFSFVEAGARLPFEWNKQSKGFRTSGGHDRDDGSGVGDLDVAAKISIPLGPIALGPYLKATIPTSSSPHFDKHRGGEVGAAASAGLFGQALVFHANVDGGWRDGGWTSINYRFGVSVVPFATKILLVRPYVYLDGKQRLHDQAGSELRVAAGAQALVLDFITLEAGGDYRFLNDATAHGLGDDRGTWTFEIGAGVAF